MRHLSFSLTIKELKGYHDEMKIIIKKKWPGSNVKYSLWKVDTYTCVGICRILSKSWGIFALTFKLVTQGIRIFSLLCVESVQFFIPLTFTNLMVMIYIPYATLWKKILMQDLSNLKKKITVIMENKFCKTISITDIEPITSILLLVASFGSKFNKLASETIVLASDWWT